MSVKKRKGGRWCSVPTCKNNSNINKDISFFGFPKDEPRAKNWSIQCRRLDLLQRDALYLSRNCHICSVHFEPSTFANFQRNRLKPDAVPTLFNTSKQASQKRKPRRKRDNETYKMDEETKIDEQIHFEQNQFEQARKDGWKKLKPNAVPTFFPVTIPPKTSKRKSTNSQGAKSETETDVKNYTQYKMGFSKRLLMADGVLPSKFECQTHPRKEALNAGTSGSTFVKSGKIDLDCSRSSNDNDDTVETTAEMESIGTSFKTRWSNMRDSLRKSLKHGTMKNGQSIKKIKMYKHSENLSSLNTNSESDKVQYDEPQQQTLEENDDSLHGEVPVPSDELHIKEEPCDVESDDPLLPIVIVKTELPHPKLEQCEVEIDETDLGSYVSYPNPKQFEIHPTFGPSKSRASTEPVNCPTHENKLVEYIISKNEKENPQHPVDTFLARIAATLKTFSPYHLHLAKAEICNIVQKYEFETIMADQHIPPNRNIMTPNSPASSSVSSQHSTNLQYHLNIVKPTKQHSLFQHEKTEQHTKDIWDV